MMNFKVVKLAGGRFGVYRCTEMRELLVHTCKTRRGAEAWIKRYA